MIRATYASQDNLEKFLAGIFGEGRAEVSVSAPVYCLWSFRRSNLTVFKVGTTEIPL